MTDLFLPLTQQTEIFERCIFKRLYISKILSKRLEPILRKS